MTLAKKKGVILLIAPITVLIVVLVSYGVANYFLSRSIALPPEGTIGLAQASLNTAVFQMTKVTLGLLGTAAVASMFICWPLGIYFLAKKEHGDQEVIKLQTQDQYQNLTTEQIAFIQKWSWGAFFSPFVWTLGNKLYLWAVGTLVPLFGIYAWIKLASSGREMAWVQKGWTGFEQFKKRQKIMMLIIIVVTILAIGGKIIGFSFSTKNQPGLTISN